MNAECYGGNRIAPREGYFRTDLKAEEIIECLN